MKRLLLLAVLLSVAVTATAKDGAEALQLRDIMREMSQDMQAAGEALVLRDWTSLARHAENIAHHDKPPMGERLKILAFIGTDVGDFRALDGRVTDAAEKLMGAAGNTDAEAALQALSDMQAACGACHERFRTPFLEHFY